MGMWPQLWHWWAQVATNISASVFIDWNNDGDYGDTGENVTNRALEGLIWSRGLDQIRVISPPSAGGLACELDNRSKDYSPENTSSPLYGNIDIGRRIKLQITDDGGTITDQWTGILDEFQQHPEVGKRSVGISALGNLSKLRGKKFSTALYSNIRTDQALGFLLDAVGWPAGDRVLGTGQTTFSWFWLDDEDGFEAMLSILASEGPGAAIYEDSSGKLVFRNRNHLFTNSRSTTSNFTYNTRTNAILAAYEPRRKDVINVCTLAVVERALQTSAVVWSYGATLTFAANETKKIQARPNSSDPFQNALVVAGTDYTVTAGSIISTTLDRSSGPYCTITMTAGSAGATVTGLQMRAQSVTITRTHQATNTRNTSVSQGKYNIQPFSPNVRPEIPVAFAQDYANAVVAWYEFPRPAIVLSLFGYNGAMRSELLSRDILDRVTVVDTQSGLNHDFYIFQLRGRLQAGPRLFTEFGCEKVMDGPGYAIWGSAKWGSNTWAF